MGNVLTATSVYGDVTSYEYDDLYRNIKVSNNFLGTSTFEYDNFSRIKSTKDSLGNEYKYEYDNAGNRMYAITESEGRFHTEWLNNIYPRLKVAKDLLCDGGVIYPVFPDHKEMLDFMCNQCGLKIHFDKTTNDKALAER